jgi:hypothetical protein
MRLRRLVADSLKRLVQLFHSAWRERFSPENWCLGVEMARVSGFGAIWGVLGDFWVQNRHFFSFFGYVTPPRGH